MKFIYRRFSLKKLWALCQKDDIKALTVFRERYENYIMSYALRFTDDRSFALSLSDICLYELFQDRKGIDDPAVYLADKAIKYVKEHLETNPMLEANPRSDDWLRCQREAGKDEWDDWVLEERETLIDLFNA